VRPLLRSRVWRQRGHPGAAGVASGLLGSYNLGVARGWESKSVQAQIESAKLRRGEIKPRLTPEQLDVQRKCESLLLHRTRVLCDLEKCREDRYRKTLADGLAYLEQQLAALGWRREQPAKAVAAPSSQIE
jgi:hypothetical protein